MDLNTPLITEPILSRWQEHLDLLIQVIDLPIALIVRFSDSEARVIVSGCSITKPYETGEKIPIDESYYWQRFLHSRDTVVIPDARNDVLWPASDEAKRGLTSFMGAPIAWPSGVLFGAIAVLDGQPKSYSETALKLALHFRDAIETDLALLASRGSNDKTKCSTVNRLDQGLGGEPSSLDHSNAQLQAILDNTGAVVSLLDADERYLFVNRQWERVFHLSRAQVSGKSLYDVFPEETANAFHTANAEVLRTGRAIEQEEITPQDDGLHTYISLKVPILDDRGNARAFCGISTDITARKKAEEELRASKESFERLFENAPFPFWEMDLSAVKKYLDELRSKGIDPCVYLTQNRQAALDCVKATRHIRFNKATLRLNGAQSERELLEWFSGALADESQMHLANFRDLVVSLAAGNTLFELEGIASTMGGGFINYMCRVIVLPGCEDTWSRVLVSTLDLTQQKRAEEARAFLAAVVESSTDAITGSDIEGRFISWNKGAEALFGYRADEVIGRSAAMLMPPERQGDLPTLLEVVRRGESASQFETVRISKDGRRIDVSLTVSPIRDSKGVVTGISAVARDITERKRAENELREAKEQYETLFEEAPISLYELDLSEMKKMLDALRAQGVSDFDRYFDEHPEALAECAGQFKMLRANKTTLRVRSAETVEELTQWMRDALADPRVSAIEAFRDVLMAFNSGATLHEAERVAVAAGGKLISVLRRMTIAPGSEDSWSKVLVSTVDLTDLRRAEEAKSQLAAIVESSGDAIFGNTKDGIVRSWNESAARLYGYSADEMIGRPFSLLIPPDLLHEVDIVRNKLTSGERVEQFETVHTAKDGRRIDVSVTVSPIKDANGIRIGAATISRDITARKQAEDALLRSEQEYANLVNTIDGIVWQADADTFKFSFVSKQAERILGYPVEQWLEETGFWKDHIHPDDRGWAVELCVNATAEKKSHQFKYRMIDAKGRIVWLHDFVTVQVEGDRAVQLRGVMVDITERERALEALRKSEEEHRLFFELDLAANFVSTPEGKLLKCNPAFARILGFDSVDEAMAADASSVYPGKGLREGFLALLQSHKRLDLYEEDLRRKDGAIIHVIENVIGSFDAQGRLTEIRGYLMDDTERRKVEEQLRQSQKLEAIGRLAGGVAHDFNNVLTIILGYAQLLLRKIPRSDPLYEEALQIRAAGERASGLTNQLLAFSRKQILQPRVLSLNEVVANLDKMLRRVIGEDIDLISIPDPNAGMVKADLGQIEQVILNLAVNARDAMPGGGRLTIETANVYLDENYADSHIGAKPGRYVMIAVSDNGAGIDEQVRSHIFEPFFTTKEAGKGTGLGLSTVYGIVKQSGGNIWVYSELGRGSSFKIYLPRVDEGPDTGLPIAVTESDGRGIETVLVVEDEAPVRRLSAKGLRDAGYSVLEAASAGEAMALMATPAGQAVQMLVTDVIMPGMGGKELVDRVLADRPEIRVLFVTGYTDNAIVHHGYLDTGIEVLQKPFTPTALARRVRQILDKARDS